MLKKFTAVLSSLLLAVGLSVIAVSAPASATTPYPPTGAEANSPSNWEMLPGEECTKLEPVTTVPYTLGNPPAGSVWSKIIVKAGSGADANTIYTTGTGSAANTVYVTELVAGTKVQHSSKDSISHLILCSVPAPPTTGTDSVDCTSAVVYLGSKLTNGNYINMTVSINGQDKQMQAYVDIRQSQHPASESGLILRIQKADGSQIYLPISNAQRDSGVLTFTYSAYLTGSWTVKWVQFDGHNWHFGADGNYLTCGTQQASAAVVLTDATCDSAQTVAKGTISGATWGELVITGSTYSVTATANAGYSFNGQPTKTFTGTLSPPKSGVECQPVLKCLPKSAVSYTYDPATNSGVITVVNPDPTKYTNDLCDGFWVTATSWKYTSSTLWPQARDVVQKLPKITSVGTYPYVAAVSCGQGDIYASFTAQPDPTPNLYGPGNPFPETFLHSMGFTGPNPTWMRQAFGCNSTTVVEPTATPITECGTYGSIVVPADTMYIDYTLTGNGQTGVNTVTAVANAPFVLQGYPTGGWTFDLGQYYDCPKLAEPVAPTLTTVTECGVYGTVTPQVTEGVDYVVEFDQATGDYTVTATPQDGYRFADDKTEIVFEGNVGAYYECVIDTDASIVYGECTWNTDGTANFREVAITFDNTKSNVDVPFVVLSFPEYNQVVPAGQKVTFSVANIWPAGGGYTVNAGTESFDLTIVPCDEPEKPQPKTRDEVVSSYDCDTTVATVTTTTYTTDWVFDTETATWVEGEEVAGQPVVTTRAMTPEEISTESCLVTVTDPQASTCDVVVDTELTSWIRVELNPNVQYTIDGTVVTEEFTAVEPGAHQVVATALNGYTLQGAQPEPDDWTDTTHTWNFIAVDTSKCEPPTLSQVLPTYSSQQLGCTANGSYTIGAEFGDVTWTVNGTTTAPGTYTVTEPGTVTLVATPTDPTDGFDSAWTQGSTPIVLTFERPTEGCEPPTLAEVMPSYSSTPLTCTAAGSYTIGAEFGDVTWTVDGTETAAGTYPVSKAGSVVIEASPTNEDDTLAAEWTDEPITLTFALPSGDCSTPMLALTGAVASFAPVWAAALLALTGLGLVLLRRKNTAQ